jgi:Zn-dependent protease with chaperone function
MGTMPTSSVPGTIAEYAGQSITHAAIAVLVVEILLRVWRVSDGDERVAFRLLPLVLPVVVLPVFWLAAPWRAATAFEDGWALFAGARWGAAGAVGLAGAVLLGLTLLLADLPRFLRRWGPRRRGPVPPLVATPPEVAAQVATLAHAFALRPPAVLVLDMEAPALLVSGIRRPVLMISRGTLDSLDARQRHVTLAHELAHLARRDPLLGWLLMGARVLSFFNPVTQLLARTVVREAEWRADDLAVAVTGDAATLATALERLGGGRGDRRHLPAILARHRRLLARRDPEPTAFPRLRLGLTGASLALLLFFVV